MSDRVVYVPQEADGEFGRHLAALVDPIIRLQFGPSMPDPAEFEILVAGRPTVEQLTASVRLRRVIIPYAGVPPKTLAALESHPDVVLHNLHHNAAPAAELAVALMLAVGKRVVPIDAALRRDDWRPRYAMDHSILFTGKTALIVGHGAIGRRIDATCRGLGMQVIGTRRRARSTDERAGIFAPERLPDLLPRADVLFICLPTTDATRALLGAGELALLPDRAILVNVARGPVVDEQALFDALRSGRLAGAGLDVWYRYPQSVDERAATPPATLPFAELDNVVMSPHRAGHCAETERLRATHLAELLNADVRGEEPANRVDRELGY